MKGHAMTAQEKRIMVDMSATLIHHGHIRILKAAKELGRVIVALTTCEEIRAKKGYAPELDYAARKEILEAIRYVDEVVPSKWMLDDAFLDAHRVDLLVHGHDNSNQVRPERLVILPRTQGVSSTLLRARTLEAVGSILRLREPA
jgi:glycerol-3-phosphate cytidylyltransferase